MVRYVQCLVCGRVTPADRGTCYHCKSPLPTKLELPEGLVVCPNCLRVTPVESGFCRHCKSPLPESLVDAALKQLRRYRVLHGKLARPSITEKAFITPYYNSISEEPQEQSDNTGTPMVPAGIPIPDDGRGPRVVELPTELSRPGAGFRVLVPRVPWGDDRM